MGSRNIRHEYYDKIVNWLEDVNTICNKLGGFPVFDKYYKNFWEGNIANKAFGSCVPPNQYKIPKNSEEDVHDKYIWENFRRSSIRHLGWTNNLVQINKNWSVASIDKDAAMPDVIWYRRLR